MDATTHFATRAPDVDAAYEFCRNLVASSYENFNIGSRFIRSSLRPHFYAVYAFCRLVDDLGDEAVENRIELLDRWEDELMHCYRGTPNLVWFQALKQTIEEFNIPSEPFLRLIEANRRDQRQTRYDDFDALVDYCTYSATPVGHLVLYLYGYFSDQMAALSDHTCIALQLANFWQDVSRDFQKGRIYIPQSDLMDFGVSGKTIEKGEATEAFREMMRFEVDRTRNLFRAGYALLEHLESDFRLEFAAITAGGLAVLDAIEKLDYDTLSNRPTVSNSKKISIMLRITTRKMFGLSLVSDKSFVSVAYR